MPSEKFLIMKNNKNNKYSKTIKIIDEKKNQILKYLINNYANNYAIKKSDHYDNKYENNVINDQVK